MTTKKRVEITIETERVIIAPSSSSQPCLWCDSCAMQVDMLTPDLAAAQINVPPRLIYRWIEAGQLHYREDSDGAILICRNSLFGDQPVRPLLKE